MTFLLSSPLILLELCCPSTAVDQLWVAMPSAQPAKNPTGSFSISSLEHSHVQLKGHQGRRGERLRVGDALNRTCHWQNSNVDSQAHVCPVGPWQRTCPEGPPGTTSHLCCPGHPRIAARGSCRNAYLCPC